jgi:hypothetical protein
VNGAVADDPSEDNDITFGRLEFCGVGVETRSPNRREPQRIGECRISNNEPTMIEQRRFRRKRS